MQCGIQQQKVEGENWKGVPKCLSLAFLGAETPKSRAPAISKEDGLREERNNEVPELKRPLTSFEGLLSTPVLLKKVRTGNN